MDISRGGLGGRLALSLTLALLPVGLLATLQSYQSYRHSRDLEQRAMFGEAEQALRRANRSLDEASGATRAMAQIAFAMLSTEPGARCSHLLGELAESSGQLLYAGFIAADGSIPCASLPAGGGSNAELIADLTIEAPVALYLASPYAPAEPAVHIIQPVVAAGAKVGWMLTIWPSWYFFADPSREDVSDAMLVDRRGTVFAPSSPASVPAGVDLSSLNEAGRQLFLAESVDGTRMLYAAVPLAGGGLTALAARPTSRPTSIFGAGGQLWTFALPVLMWGISLFVAVVSTNRLATGPLRQLMKMTRAMSHGVRDLSGLRLRRAPAELQSLSDRFMEMAQRVTRYETSLEEALKEKTVLLSEVHHRVRNNLQLLVSVLNMQERAAASPAVKDALARFRQRVLGLSAAHEHLYGAEVMSRRLGGQLVADVVTSSMIAAGHLPGDARLAIEDIALPQDAAVPVALFVAEAVPDALSAVENARPDLRVSLARDADGRIRLSVERGPAQRPPAVDDLGPRLMRALAEQIGGTSSRESTQHGYRAELVFRGTGPA